MRPVTRRAWLAGALALGAAGCSQIIDRAAQPDLPDTLRPPSTPDQPRAAHLLKRAAFGPRPGDVARVQSEGLETWLDAQLDYANLSDTALDWRLRRYDSLTLNAPDVLGFNGPANRRYVRDELAAATLLRAIYSQRQLYERMVGFWGDHFSLFHFKGDVSLLKTVDDREVIRPRALANFGTLLRASTHSPAMLVYLDNILNHRDHPNENYAREIMELHTLGVDGGYTETDIQEVARCFTGWSVDEAGRFAFIPAWHDDGEKTVLGHTIPAGGGKSDGDRVLDILLGHPSTARFICTKLARHFVADDPPTLLVDDLVRVWESHSPSERGGVGPIRPVLRTLFTHQAFWEAPPKLRRPFELLTALLRIGHARYNGDAALINLLESMGHRPFNWPTPDGYPDIARAWSGDLLERWNLALDAAHNRLPGVTLDAWDALAEAGGARTTAEKQRFFAGLFYSYLPADMPPLADNPRDSLALLLAAPTFQWK